MPDRIMSEIQFIAVLAEKSGFTQKQTRTMLRTINAIVAEQLGKQGPGQVLVPGLIKMMVLHKPATPQHEGVNSLTQMPMTYPPKAAHKLIKARALKALREAL